MPQASHQSWRESWAGATRVSPMNLITILVILGIIALIVFIVRR